jgi:hypothetical protein
MDLSNPSHPVLSGLLRKRQEIAAEIEELESKLHGLVTEIDAASDPETRPKLVLSLLRENGNPMSHRQIIEGSTWLTGCSTA